MAFSFHIYHADYLTKIDKIDEAIDNYYAAINLEPDLPDVYISTSDLLIKKQEYKKAAEILKKGLSRFPHNEMLGNALRKIEIAYDIQDQSPDI